jgi:5'-methylthioadenosine phosphorylase
MNNQKNEMIGIIGGSGIYDIPSLKNKEWITIHSPFGSPSDDLLLGEIHGQKIVFLPRHSRGHKIPPSEVNYLANIDVLKRVGVTSIISVSAVGSLREDYQPGKFIIIDQFIDRTFARKKSFFGSGMVSHISMAHPVCDRLGSHLESAAVASGMDVVRGGIYLVMEGPQFSTLAESNLYRQWGCDVIGMTNMPEAKLAREAEICYATVAMVTDYDCWHPGHENVTVEKIIEVLGANANQAKILIEKVAPIIFEDSKANACKCRRALDFAIITHKESRDPEIELRLDAVASRILNSDL